MSAEADAVPLRHGGYRAVVHPFGARLGRLSHDGADLVEPAPGGPDDRHRGSVLAPWPNRVGDACYTFGGERLRLPVTEPDRGHALHGLAHSQRWRVADARVQRAALELEVPTGPGWPFRLHLAVTYTLADDGLGVLLVGTNVGDRPLPYGCGAHPYLVCGDPPVTTELTLPAATRLEIDDRLLPTGSAPVQDVAADFRRPAVIGSRTFDHCFTDLASSRDGQPVVMLRGTSQPAGPAGHPGVSLTWGDWGRWVQVHTPGRPAEPGAPHGVAVEPMSCPPDALRTGTDLVVLSPGRRHEAWWRIAAGRPAVRR